MEGAGIDLVYNLEIEDDHNYFAAGILVSNCHYYKNLPFVTRHTRLPGVGGGAGSDRAMDMFLKSQHIQRKNGGRGLIGLSGTPISNSLCEMYTVKRFFNLKDLKRRGLSRFDNWLQTFGEITTSPEAAPEGGYRERTRVAQFSNAPEMCRMYREIADVKLAKDLNLPTPQIRGGAPQNVVAAQSGALGHFMNDLRERALVLTGQKGQVPDLKDDNFLKLTGDARKASLDLRLVPGYEDVGDDPGSKVNLCVRNVLDAHARSGSYKGTQLVFLDMSTPKGKAESELPVHAAMAAKAAYDRAVEAGLSEKEAQKEGKAAGLAAKKQFVESAKAKIAGAKAGAQAAAGDAEKAALEGGASAKEAKAAAKDAFDAHLRAWQDEQDALADGTREGEDGAEIEDESEARDRFSVYSDIKAKLVAGGVPEEEIAFIHDYNTDARKTELREKMNRGEIRVLLGSTAKMGAGMNVQERLFALHHLDCPWKPSDLEQREGRIVRQGNLHHAWGIPVEINRYATKGSFDEFMWQQIETKARFIAQTRSGNFDGRRVDDIDEGQAQAAAMKALASDSPEAARLTELDLQKKRLESHRRGEVNARNQSFNLAQSLPQEIARHKILAQTARENAGLWAAHPQSESSRRGQFALRVGETLHSKREDAGDAILASQRRVTSASGTPIGEYGPFSLHGAYDVDPTSGNRRFTVHVKNAQGHHVTTIGGDLTPRGVTTSLDGALRGLEDHAKMHEELAARKASELERHQKTASASWGKQAEYDQVVGEMRELEEKRKARLEAERLGRSEGENGQDAEMVKGLFDGVPLQSSEFKSKRVPKPHQPSHLVGVEDAVLPQLLRHAPQFAFWLMKF